jgi:hypothetical protein
MRYLQLIHPAEALGDSLAKGQYFVVESAKVRDQHILKLFIGHFLPIAKIVSDQWNGLREVA